MFRESKLDEIHKVISETNDISKSEINDCIKITASNYSLQDNIVAEIIYEMIMNQKKNNNTKEEDSNFISIDYNITIDDQAQTKVSFENQEYINKDFRYKLPNRFPKYNKYSYIPNVFYNKPFWEINNMIFDSLKKGENKNWTNQTLSYSRTNIAGRHMIDCVIKPIIRKAFTDNSKLIVIDATANTGSDSITFGMEKFVKQVISYEMNDIVYKMLSNNVKLYGMNNRIIPLNKFFTYTDALKNSIVVIDPPYESPNNATNFNLSIDSTPIYNVCKKLLDKDVFMIVLSMPKYYKYNKRFAINNHQNVSCYQLGNINNKLFVVMKEKDGNELKIENFSSFNIISKKDNPFECLKTPETHKIDNKSIIQSERTPKSIFIGGSNLLASIKLYSCKEYCIFLQKQITRLFDVKNQNLLINTIMKTITIKNIYDIDKKDYIYDYLKTLKKLSDANRSPLVRGTKKADDLLSFINNSFKNKKLDANSVVLDYGTGDGKILSELSNSLSLKRENAIAFDISKVPQDPSYTILSDINLLNDNSVDCVLLFEVLHHISPKDRGSVIENLTKKLKIGGIIITKEHDFLNDTCFLGCIFVIHEMWRAYNNEEYYETYPIFDSLKYITVDLFGKDYELKNVDAWSSNNYQRIYKSLYTKI